MQEYAKKLDEERAHFQRCEDQSALASTIAGYYVQKYRWPRLEAVCGAKNHFHFYTTHFSRQLRDPRPHRLLSIGCGDAQVETRVATNLVKQGRRNFVFDCLELSDHQVERAQTRAHEAGVGAHFNFIQEDFNFFTPTKEYAGVMAHYVLHHVVELEHLLGGIRESLTSRGVFLTMDIVGRNGHQRWPETLEVVRSIWDTLPEEKKYHRFFKKTYKTFQNFDCSKVGFEGIRAQDILPILVDIFGFESFLAMGGVSEVFMGPVYGNNFDPGSKRDRAVIDLAQYLNDLLIDLGHIKPTHVFAVMKKDKGGEPKVYRHWTPEFCIRPTAAEATKPGQE